MSISTKALPAPSVSEQFENERLQALYDTHLLDSVPGDRFDSITRLVARVFKTPIALISLVDANRQWFLSRMGLETPETPRCEAFCAHAINESQLLVVENAMLDPSFKDNPLVTGYPNIRFYAGAVIKDENGYPLGTLCIIDTTPRSFSQHDKETLLSFCDLARQEVLLPSGITTHRLKARLKQHQDPLTNALLDDAFFNATQQTVQQCSGNGEQLLISVKICDLSWLNNTYSKYVADEVLLELATRLRAAINAQANPVFGRVGHDKLCAFLTDIHKDAISELLRSLKKRLAGTITTADISVSPSLKVAVTASAENTSSAQEAFKFTHLALTSLPDKEGVQVWLVSEHEKSRLKRRLTIGRDLPSAIDKNELHIAFQPKVCATTHQLTGMEALLRWQHKTLGPVAPDAIIDTATATNLLYTLEKWVFYTTCSQLKQWQSKGFRVPTVSINITGETLLRNDFVDFADSCLQQFGLQGSSLDIEIVEGSVFEEFDIALRAMQKLIKLGISFSLDDFGTGFSSLSYLRNLPIKNLKIDKSFVDDIIESQEAATLCGGIISLAKSLELTIIAEGVETENQATVLKALRCDSFQGYYFYKPLPHQQLEQLLQTG